MASGCRRRLVEEGELRLCLVLGCALVVVCVEFSFTQDMGTSNELLRSGSYETTVINGTTVIDGSLMLPNRTNRYGVSSRVVYKEPITLYNSSSNVSERFSFSTSFTFSRTEQGDGFAFIITPSPNCVPEKATAGAWLGMFECGSGFKFNSSLRIVAVEFDLVKNPWDSDSHHAGLDVSSLESVRATDLGFYGFFLTDSSQELVAFIDYDAHAKTLTLQMAHFPADKANAVQVLQQRGFDLSSWVEETSYVGFSAANGGSAGHTILHQWQFSSFLADDAASAPGTSSLQTPRLGGMRAVGQVTTAVFCFIQSCFCQSSSHVCTYLFISTDSSVNQGDEGQPSPAGESISASNKVHIWRTLLALCHLFCPASWPVSLQLQLSM